MKTHTRGRYSKVLVNFGDRSLLDYDGCLLTRRGDCAPGDRENCLLEWWYVVCRVCGETLGECRHSRDEWEKFRAFDIHGCYVPVNVAAELSWLTAEHIASMETSLGLTPGEWKDLAESEDVISRARALLAVLAYYGSAELDSYPVRMRLSELLRARPYYRAAIAGVRSGRL